MCCVLSNLAVIQLNLPYTLLVLYLDLLHFIRNFILSNANFSVRGWVGWSCFKQAKKYLRGFGTVWKQSNLV